MKQKLKESIKVVLLIVIGVWILDKTPFYQDINHEIFANIYKNGVTIGQTSVIVDGKKSNYLFSDKENYFGIFHILSYEKTGREDMNARIKWSNVENIQDILYMMPGHFLDMDLIRTIIINEKMTKFAVMFKDNTVVATSDEIYELYTKHISYYSDKGITSVKDVEKVPKID